MSFLQILVVFVIGFFLVAITSDPDPVVMPQAPVAQAPAPVIVVSQPPPPSPPPAPAPVPKRTTVVADAGMALPPPAQILAIAALVAACGYVVGAFRKQ